MIEFLDARLMAGAKLLFEQVNFRLDQGVCVGVVGDNGAGKSSLFATILGERALDGGDMRVPKDWRFAHMTQEVDALDKSAIDYVLMGDSEYIDLYQKLQSQSDDASLHQRFWISAAIKQMPKPHKFCMDLALTNMTTHAW